MIESYRHSTGQNINLESYTSAGIHNHQIKNFKNNDVGMITSDDGHRFLSSVQGKQKMAGRSEHFYVRYGMARAILPL